MRFWLPLLLLLSCTPPPEAVPVVSQPVTAPTPVWPDEGARLTAPVLEVPDTYERKRVYIDAGHGARGNEGNQGAFCQREQDFTLEVSQFLARRLRATGLFDVRTSRGPGEVVGYRTRVREAEAWGADVFLSLHSDVRGQVSNWEPEPGMSCPSSASFPGFTVLWSDDAAPELQQARRQLARTFAWHLEDAGFGICDCWVYWGLYEVDDVHPAVWVDRHQPGGRIYVLRIPQMPSIILETHNAWHTGEVNRWEQAHTRDIFGRAVIAALLTL